MPEGLSKLVFNNANTQLIRGHTRGAKEEVHIPWEDDRPVEAEVEEWYNMWVALAVSNGDDSADMPDDMEVGEEDGGEPLMRTWQRNDKWDDKECEAEDIALVGFPKKENVEKESTTGRRGGGGSANEGERHERSRAETQEGPTIECRAGRKESQESGNESCKGSCCSRSSEKFDCQKKEEKDTQNVIDDDKSGDDAAAAVNVDAAATDNEAKAAPSLASSSLSSENEDVSGSGAESMKHDEQDMDDAGEG
ncbi:hypothetical protein CBR_g3107 [Chara braunii]|uniref:Uncharacterized protein n=1 Tax=Chara braunii TaxID=69332 RepID=A0A388KES2_CHABU|nr:hypothetical protein CBR_g3107 [Chara braunii]|eukprot:GBG68562.1 hypothetical protein CBR_g3107 [Chara braunii]